MRDLEERDLRKLFRSVGHHHPKQELTERIMARVTLTRRVRPVEPVISMRGWTWILAGTALLLALGMISGGGIHRPVPVHWQRWVQVAQQGAAQWAGWLAAGGALAFVFTALDTVLRARGGTAHR